MENRENTRTSGSHRNKRLVVRLLLCMLTVAVASIACFLVSQHLDNKIDPLPPRADAYFYDADYVTDILTLPEYTEGYDRTVYYYTGSMGTPLTADNCNA